MPAGSKSEAKLVCLLSAHSIVLGEMQRVLSSAPFNLTTSRLASSSDQVPARAIPVADVYVIDAESCPEGVEKVVREITTQNPEAHMLVLGERFIEDSAFPLLRLGVKGLITHGTIDGQLGRALVAVGAGGYWVPRNLLASFVDSVVSKTRQAEAARRTPGVAVSRREKEIIDCLLTNLSNKEIAGRLNISERTVKFHVSNLLSKFGVQRRADLILLWFQRSENRAATGDPKASRIQ